MIGIPHHYIIGVEREVYLPCFETPSIDRINKLWHFVGGYLVQLDIIVP